MQVKINKLPGSQLELEIELFNKEFDKFIDQATLNLGRDLEIKGFRKGKVPKEIIKKKLKEADILVEAADLAIKENYRKAVLKNKIEAISQPRIDILKLPRPTSPLAQSKAGGAPKNPFIFKATISVLPEIKLPDYKKITSKIKRKKVSVQEKETEAALNWLQRSRAKFTFKNGPAQKGDFVEIEYSSLHLEKSTKDTFILGEGHFLPGFEEKLIGMKTGKEKEISVDIPKNHFLKNLAGKNINLKVKVKSVQKVELLEINDEFAKSLGKFENLAALKKSIKDGLNLEKEQAETQRVRAEILEKIVQETVCEIPEILVQNEQSRLIEIFKKDISEKLKTSWEDYLNKIYPVKSSEAGAKQFNGAKKAEKEILESFLPEAKKRIKNFLVLREIGKREKIEVSEEEIREETNKILKHYATVEKVKKELDPEKLKEYTKEVLINEKIFKLLEDFTTQ